MYMEWRWLRGWKEAGRAEMIYCCRSRGMAIYGIEMCVSDADSDGVRI